MTKEEIKKEFELWIDAGQPAIWYKTTFPGDTWVRLSGTNWASKINGATVYYVIDDEYAELKKAFHDGKTIQRITSDGFWITITYPDWTYPIEEYRIEPEEPIYEYQWLFKNNPSDTRYQITPRFWTEKEKRTRGNWDWIKIEETKRLRK